MSQVKRKAEEDIDQEAAKRSKLTTDKKEEEVTKFQRPPWLVVAEPDGDPQHRPFFTYTGGDYCVSIPDDWLFREEIIPVIMDALFPIQGVAGIIAEYASTEGCEFDICIHTKWDKSIHWRYWSSYYSGWFQPDKDARCMMSVPLNANGFLCLVNNDTGVYEKRFQGRCRKSLKSPCSHAIIRHRFTVPLFCQI